MLYGAWLDGDLGGGNTQTSPARRGSPGGGLPARLGNVQRALRRVAWEDDRRWSSQTSRRTTHREAREPSLRAHFQTVAARLPVPLIVYNIPYRTRRGLGSAALLEPANTENIVGVKQAVGGIGVDTLQVLAGAPPSFSVLGGDDPFLFPLVLMGAAGAIAASANVATEHFAAMIDDGLAGRLAEDRRHAEALLPLTLALFAEPSPAVMKAVQHAQRNIPTPHVRMPLADASPAAVERPLAVRDSLSVLDMVASKT